MQVDQGPELVVTAGHLEAAFAKVFRSVKPDDIRAYERLLATLQS
jgi:hypothetical protein